jgi:hypothetical protein
MATAAVRTHGLGDVREGEAEVRQEREAEGRRRRRALRLALRVAGAPEADEVAAVAVLRGAAALEAGPDGMRCSGAGGATDGRMA